MPCANLSKMPFILTLCFYANIIAAQTIAISSEIPMESNRNYDILGYFNKNIMLLEEDGRNVILHSFDNNLKKVNTSSITTDSRKARLFGYVPQDSLLTLYYKYSENGEYIVSVVNYNPQLNVESKSILKSYSKNQTRVFPINVSDDHAFHLVTLEEGPSHIDRYIMYHAPSNTILWEEVDPLADDRVFAEDRRGRIITNKGAFISLYAKGRSRLKNNYNISYIGADGFRQAELQLDNIPITDIHLSYDNQSNSIIVTCIYLNDNLSEQEGIMIIKLDQQLNYIGDIKKIPFTRQTINDYFGQNQRNKNGISDMYINGIQERQDGGILLFCEQKKEISRVNNTARSAFVPTSTSIDYYMDDIVLTSLNADGNLEWQKLLQKKQYSYDDNAVYSSYFIHANPSKIHLLYNDEIKNENTISEYTISPLGKIERRVLFNTFGSDLHLQIRNSVQIDANSSILPSIRKSSLRLVKIEY